MNMGVQVSEALLSILWPPSLFDWAGGGGRICVWKFHFLRIRYFV